MDDIECSHCGHTGDLDDFCDGDELVCPECGASDVGEDGDG